jgi:hypothetical protein
MVGAKELSKYKLGLVAVQEVRCDRGGIEPAGERTHLSVERGMITFLSSLILTVLLPLKHPFVHAVG